MSQGLALAILALIQTMPEFAVEAVIAWKAGKDPNMVHLAIANFTGSLRLLTGFGWPMIYAVAAFSSRRKHSKPLGAIRFAGRSCGRGPGPAAAAGLLRRRLGQGQPVAGGLRRSRRRPTSCTSAFCCACRRARRRWKRTTEVPAVSRWALSFRGWKRWLARGGALRRGRRGHRPGRRAVPQLDALDRGEPGHLAVRLHPVGRAVHLGVPGEDLRVRLGPPDHAGAGRAAQHGLLQHQPVGRPLRACSP